MEIDTNNFKFYKNSKIKKEIEDIGLNNISIEYYKIFGLTKKLNKKIYVSYNDITIDIILNKLEDDKIQEKIIKSITNYKKIPKKTIDYFKNTKSLFNKDKN